jgi:hypothetical protein
MLLKHTWSSEMKGYRSKKALKRPYFVFKSGSRMSQVGSLEHFSPRTVLCKWGLHAADHSIYHLTCWTTLQILQVFIIYFCFLQQKTHCSSSGERWWRWKSTRGRSIVMIEPWRHRDNRTTPIWADDWQLSQFCRPEINRKFSDILRSVTSFCNKTSFTDVSIALWLHDWGLVDL